MSVADDGGFFASSVRIDDDEAIALFIAMKHIVVSLSICLGRIDQFRHCVFSRTFASGCIVPKIIVSEESGCNITGLVSTYLCVARKGANECQKKQC